VPQKEIKMKNPVAATWKDALELVRSSNRGTIDIKLGKDGYGNSRWFCAKRVNSAAWSVYYSRVIGMSVNCIFTNEELEAEIISNF
jgi:hypothetical protein